VKRRPRRAAPAPPPAGTARAKPAALPSARRRYVFRAVVLALPWLLLLAAELLLRALGVGAAMDFVLRQQVDGEPRLLSNPRFSWLFFEPALARAPSPFSLAERKPAGAVRVFVLGSSAAQGDPEPAFGLARVLEVLLADRYPGVELEVVNAAATAVNSHYVYQAARGCLGLEPDLLVVYAGNNEVVGPFGAGTVLSAQAPPLPLVRAQVAVQRTRTGQLAGRTVRAAARALGRGTSPGVWHGMEMFLDRQVARDDPRLARTYHNYERNLVDLCRIARGAGVPVLLSTVAVNLRSCGPFGSARLGALSAASRSRWDSAYAEARQLEAAGRWQDAALRLREAVALDAGHAESVYRLGRCELRLGRLEDARRHLGLARDLDTLRFRADSRTNAIVREVARREGTMLVDAEQALAAQSPDGLPGEETFLDHVHLTFDGNYRLAAALLDPVSLALPQPVRARASGRNIPSAEEVAHRLVYTDLDRYRIAETMQQRLRDPPFTNQPDHPEQVKRFDDELLALREGGGAAVEAAVTQYQAALRSGGAHWSLRERYAIIQKRVGNAALAADQWRILTRVLPQYPGFWLQLSRALRDSGRFGEARDALEKVLEYQPDAAVTLAELARLELAQGRTEPAREAASRAVAADPRDANALELLAATVCPRRECGPEERSRAVGLLRRALEAAPESEVIRRDLDALQGGERR